MKVTAVVWWANTLPPDNLKYVDRLFNCVSQITLLLLFTNFFSRINRPFPSSPGPLFQNEDRCSAFDMEIIFHSHASKTHFHKNGCATGFILKVRAFGTRKWPIASLEMRTMSVSLFKKSTVDQIINTTNEIWKKTASRLRCDTYTCDGSTCQLQLQRYLHCADEFILHIENI